MEIRSIEQLRNLSTLSRALFQAEVPEETLRTLPAQTLFQVINYNGIESSMELIQAANIEQVRLVLDFDLWSNDVLNEDNLWKWLELSTEDDDLELLQKIVNSLDLKIVALLIHKYLEVEQREEATDLSPGPLFFTPDKGFTWIRVLCEDQRKHFLISRLLAFLFESSSDAFYQLLATKTVTTPSQLEEEALGDRSKRLATEGFPDLKFAQEVTSFLSITEGLNAISESTNPLLEQQIVIVESLARLSDNIEPISSALLGLSNKEVALSELTLLVNAMIVRTRAALSNNEELLFLANQTHAATNLGLDLLTQRSGKSALEIIERVGLQVPFRVGLTQILAVAKSALKYETSLLKNALEVDIATVSLLELLKRPFPCLPATLSKHRNDYALLDGEHLNSRPEPFRYYCEIEELQKLITDN